MLQPEPRHFLGERNLSAAAPNAGDDRPRSERRAGQNGTPSRSRRLSRARPCRRHPDKGDAFPGPGRHNAAARNASHPPGDGACALESEKRLRFAKKRAQMRPASPARRDTRMEDRRPWRDPGQITRREFGIEKAMEEARISSSRWSYSTSIPSENARCVQVRSNARPWTALHRRQECAGPRC